MKTETLDAIEELVTEAWENRKHPLLFAQIPESLKRQGIDIKSEIGEQKLGDAIVWNGGSRFRPVKDPSDEKIRALVPSNVTESEREIFEVYNNRTRYQPSKPNVRYEYVVWSAFSKPLTKDKRFLKTGDGHIEFLEWSAGDDAPADATEISKEYVREEGEDLTDLEISKRIDEWAENSGIPRQEILYELNIRSNSNTFGLLADLDVEEQRRISIPLDILVRLLG